MASIGVWVGEGDAEKIQKKLGTGETIGQFIKALVQKNLSEHFVALECSEEEIAAIDSARNERS